MRNEVSRRWAFRYTVAAGVAVLILLGCCLIYVPRLLRAASVIYGFSHRDRPPLVVRLYNQYFGYRVEEEDAVCPGDGAPIALRVFTPIGRAQARTIVLVHGLAREGNQSPPLESFARSLTHQGFRVVVPTLPSEQKMRIEPSDLEVIDRVILWAARTGEWRPVSVAGISFGGGLSIVAAERADVRRYVRLVLCISGYNDLPTIARFFVREPVKGPDGAAYPSNVRTATAMISVRPYLAEMVPAADLPAMSAFLDELVRLARLPLPANDPLLQQLTPEQQRLFFDLQNVQTPEIQRLYLQVIERHYNEMEEVSPKSTLGELSYSLYVLHGAGDVDIPAEEVAWMEAEVPTAAEAHFLVTPWMGHAGVGTHGRPLDRLRVSFFLSQLLAAAAA